MTTHMMSSPCMGASAAAPTMRPCRRRPRNMHAGAVAAGPPAAPPKSRRHDAKPDAEAENGLIDQAAERPPRGEVDRGRC